MIDVVIDSYMGFSQKLDAHTGFDDLYDKLINKLSDKNRVINIPHRWNSWVGVDAKQVARHSNDNTYHARIGYSFGGYAAIKRCEADSKLGITVDHLFLIDAVWRMPASRWSWLARSTTLLRTVKLKIPPNVKRVTYWRQNLNFPYGHDIKILDPTCTHEDNRGYVKAKHNEMDNNQYVHNEITQEVLNELEASGR